MGTYDQRLSELEEEARKREDYLARMEAMPTPVKNDGPITAIKTQAPFIKFCDICVEPIRFIDHGRCRKCRAKISRYQENEKIRKKLIEYKTWTTQSVTVDNLIRYNFPSLKRIEPCMSPQTSEPKKL